MLGFTGKYQHKYFFEKQLFNNMFLHELPSAKELFEVVAKEQSENGLKITDAMVEKDYWLMHCLWGLQQQGYRFSLKGGTSLSKGFCLIERFSEDIDIQIHPCEQDNVKTGKNHNKPAHIEARRQFFDRISNELTIDCLTFERDIEFDDKLKMRNAGIRGLYNSYFENIPDLKPGILLEVGFDQTTPNLPCNITSWAYEKAKDIEPKLIDNRAMAVPCYCPEYTFVEKLQTISTKYRQQQEIGSMPANFLRHYYDIYKLLKNDRILKFIGTPEYCAHKNKRFRTGDEKDISKNYAFTIPNHAVKKLYSDEFEKKSTIYFGKQPEFDEILKRILNHIDQL